MKQNTEKVQQTATTPKTNLLHNQGKAGFSVFKQLSDNQAVLTIESVLYRALLVIYENASEQNQILKESPVHF